KQASGFWLGVRRLLVAASWIIALSLPFQIQPIQGTKEQAGRWQTYSPEVLAELRAQNKPVFVNLTADWCLTCLANERIALHTDAVEKVFNELVLINLKDDWTNTDQQHTLLLKEYNRSDVHLYH